MSILTPIAYEIVPSDSGIDSSHDCSRVLTWYSQENLSCSWIDTFSRNCYGVGVYYIHFVLEFMVTLFLKKHLAYIHASTVITAKNETNSYFKSSCLIST